MNSRATAEDLCIVVGVDGSPQSLLALEWAGRLAPTLGAAIAAIAVWHFETAATAYAAAEWDPEANAQQILAESLVKVFGDERPAGLSGQVLRGLPAQVLIEHSKSAKMLIVGSRGHGGFAGLLLGSVSSACAEHATCPVLVVHAPPATQPLHATTPAQSKDADEPSSNV